MSNVKHTPGPWIYQSASQTIRAMPGNYWIASMDSWDGMIKPHNEANGRLIAAAPDLLATLQEAIRYLNANDVGSAVTILNAQGRPAIAKAMGSKS